MRNGDRQEQDVGLARRSAPKTEPDLEGASIDDTDAPAPVKRRRATVILRRVGDKPRVTGLALGPRASKARPKPRA